MTPENIHEPASPKPYPGFSPFPRGLLFLAGLLPAICVYILLTVLNTCEQDERARRDALHSLEAADASLNAVWEQSARLTGHIARQLTGVDATSRSSILALYKSLWPDAVFRFYDRKGDLLPPLEAQNNPDVAPVPHTVRGIVQKALIGQTALGVTRVHGFIALSAAAPIRGEKAGVLLMSLPLDTLTLEGIRAAARADVGVLPFTDQNSGELAALADGASTFAASGGEAGRLREAIGAALQGTMPQGPMFVSFGRADVLAALMPLKGPDGAALGGLVAVPLQAAPPASPLAPLGIALATGGIALAAAAWLLRKREERLARQFAGVMAAFAEDEREGRSGRWKENTWPAPVEEALGALSGVFRTCRESFRKAREHDSPAPAEHGASAPGRDDTGNEHFMRLFDNTPVGLFQAAPDGRFLRVNPAFVHLLGYASPEQFLVASPNFSNICIYADGMLNPLSAMAEQGHVRHIISLRRHDGKVRHFTLILFGLTSSIGDHSGVIEGFLMDREAEEAATHAEREKKLARRQRASLALLLAATCRQTRSYLDPAGSGANFMPACLPEPESEAGAEPPQGPPERRASVLSVNSVLSDIYQIAMTEAESAPPVAGPIDFARFFHSLCAQVSGSLRTRGISLRFELNDNLPPRLSGPAPLLRHALERALLAVTAPVQGGWAGVSLTRDPDAPRSRGMARILFSVAWSRFPQDAGAPAGDAAKRAGQAVSGGYTTLLEVPADTQAAPAALQDTAGSLQIAEEQEVIRYLVRKMRGELLEGIFTTELRCLRMIVTLPWLSEESRAFPAEEEDAAGQADGPGRTIDGPGAEAGQPHEAQEYEPHDHEDGRVFAHGMDDELAALPDSSSLELLAMNTPESDAEAREAREREEDGLDILLVDDNLNNRLLFSLFLRDTKHRITEAHDGQQGVEAFQHGHFDVIFLNMEMPLMDGYQATRIIRALEADAGRTPTPIVAMTTYALPEFRHQCMLAGCSDFLSKPFTKNALLSMLDAYVQLGKAPGDGQE